MTISEIAKMCDATLQSKAEEYASPQQRWHNFITASKVDPSLKPKEWARAFAMKHHVSCLDILAGKDLDVKEKAGDLINYYLIYRCIRDNETNPDTVNWLVDLEVIRTPFWIIGLELLKGLEE